DGQPIHTIADAVHKFFLNLFTIPDAALSFLDTGWYPPSKTGKSGNVDGRNLKRFICSTLRPSDDTLQQELLISILTNNPELVHHYWTSLSAMSFDPRPSPKWLQNMALAARIISLPIPSPLMGASFITKILGNPVPTSPPPPIKIIADNILPSQPLTRLLLGKALQHADPVVRYTVVTVLSFAFSKMAKVKMVFDSAIASSSEIHKEKEGGGVTIQEMWTTGLEELFDEIRKRMPDLHIIVALVQSSSKVTEKKENESDVSMTALHAGALRLARWYQILFPETLMEARFDVGKFLPKDISTIVLNDYAKMGVENTNGVVDDVLMVEINILKLLLESNGFKWWNKS
ncbi:hypothetical protein HK096_010585, partial [Nowakowskiella sp. JEL0078]